MPDPEPQRDAILSALGRLLAWPEIARSPQLGRFLDYIVRRTLDGEEQAIKAYSIAVDVFGRAPDFDPQADPIVRVQARRLRSLLQEYYREAGAGEPVRIELPVGRYVPEFTLTGAVPFAELPVLEETAPPVVIPGPAQGATLSWFALAAITIGVGLAAFSLSSWGPRPGATPGSGTVPPPSVTVVEFQNLGGDAPGGPMAAGLALELVTDLEQFEDLDVRYGVGGEAGGETSTEYVLTGIVRPDGPLVQYGVILTHSASSTVVWNRTIAIAAPEAAEPQVLDRVSQALSLVLGSPRGPLHVAARQFLAGGEELAGHESLYLCGILFAAYRETGGAAEAARADACFRALPEADQETASALAATASLVADYASPEVSTLATPTARFRVAAAILERAIGLAPTSGFVWEQQARLLEQRGDVAGALAAFGSSIQLNPANADALAAYARLLALGGDLAGAEAMAREAVEDTPQPPAWYHGVPALLALRDQAHRVAIAHAERYAEADRELGPILAILAGQAAGDDAVVNRYLPQVLEVAAFRSRGVLPQLRDRISDQALMEQIRAGLTAAGVPPEALVGGF